MKDTDPAASASPPSAAPALHDPYSALRNRDYILYLAGSAIGVIGSQVVSVAVGWELYARTSSPRVLGFIGLVSAIPVIALALPSGHVADTFDRKKIMQISQFVSALCSLGLAWLSYHQGSIPLMYACLLLRSVASTFGMPARSSLLPQVVPVEMLNNAITWNSSVFQLALMIGPVLGGMIIDYNIPMAYVFDAFSMLVAFLATALMKHRPAAAVKKEPMTLKALSAGLDFVWRSKVILATLTLDLLAVLMGGATALLPVFAKDILNVGPEGQGWLRAAPAIGAVAMALLLAHRPPMKNAGRSLLFAVAGFGAATIVFGISRNFWLSLGMLFITGALDNISVVVRHTLVQTLAPDSVRGRVMAVNSMFIGASNRLGEFESGETAYWFGPVPSVVGGGIGTILVVMAVSLVWPQVRGIKNLNELKPEPEGEEAAVAAAK